MKYKTVDDLSSNLLITAAGTSTTRPRDCQSPLRKEVIKHKIVLEISNGHCERKVIKLVDHSSQRFPINAAGGRQ